MTTPLKPEDLTDEMIRPLLNDGDSKIVKAARCALGMSRGGATAQRRARSRVALILSMRRTRELG
ncbi:MAG TPA: hypothetical protein VI172_10750 [Candidatus Dormibacteraeota bacterium]